MSAAQFVGRVGGIAAALGAGMIIIGGTAVATADDAPSTRGSGSGSSDSAPARAHRGATTVAAVSAPSVRSQSPSAGPDLTETISNSLASSNVATLPDPTPNTVTLPAPAASLPAPAATLPEPAATTPTASVITPTYIATPPNPTSTTSTPWGQLGQWMINKNGQVADWVGQPYCGKGSTAGNCKQDTPGAKKMQEPINTVFVVKAPTLYQAEQNLNWAITISGFGSTPFSSIGYSGIVGDKAFKQMPRSGPLGLGLMGPLPFGLFQNGLIGSLFGIGPAYRDAPFWAANNHLRTFGGQSDGKGNFIFTASVSRENLDTTGGGLLPGHGFESYNVARQALVDKMVKAKWISGASNQGFIAMNNAIDPNNPTYTTGDHDGLAQVIAIGSLFGNAPASSATTRVARVAAASVPA